jgi:hypothetical protein
MDKINEYIKLAKDNPKVTMGIIIVAVVLIALVG